MRRCEVSARHLSGKLGRVLVRHRFYGQNMRVHDRRVLEQPMRERLLCEPGRGLQMLVLRQLHWYGVYVRKKTCLFKIQKLIHHHLMTTNKQKKGDRCEIKLTTSQCKEGLCLNSGKCVESPRLEGFVCQCGKNYHGVFCEKSVCDGDVCGENGIKKKLIFPLFFLQTVFQLKIYLQMIMKREINFFQKIVYI